MVVWDRIRQRGDAFVRRSPDPTEEGRAGAVCIVDFVSRRQLRLRDRQSAYKRDRNGRRHDDVAAALGDPKRLARELRAEAGLRRWEASRSAGNFVAVVFAFVGLMTVDLIFLVPVLSIVALVLFIFGVALIACLIAGMAMVVSLLLGGAFSTLTGAAARGLAGVGLVAGAIGGGALLLLVLDALVRLLGRYARVHYRLLSPAKT